MKNISLLITPVIIGFFIPIKTAFSQQVLPDKTFPNQVTSPDGKNFTIKEGITAQNNLFHSFQEFSIPTSGTAIFNVNSNIQNIFSRVTGNNISNIDGKISVSGGNNANLFLINPHGIIFGKNATLNVQGSFVATTANAIAFGNQGNFGVNTGHDPSLLTVNPSALLYNQINAQANITNQGNLTVSTGKNILLAGGNVTMDGSRITAPSGTVELTGLKQNGQIGLNINNNNPELILNNNGQLAKIKIDNSSDINLRSQEGGNLLINADTFELLNNSSIRLGITGNTGKVAGDVRINTLGNVTIDNNSLISNEVRPNSTGTAGNINISTNSLIMTNSTLYARTFGQGDAGAVIINAQDQVFFDGANSSLVSTGIFNTIQTGAIGSVKGIQINTNSLILKDGAEIQTITRGTGNAGPITINATGAITLQGTNELMALPTGIFSNVQSGIGQGGMIEINGRSLSLTTGANITASSRGEGNAGNITFNITDEINLSGVNNRGDISGIFAATDGQGKGGNIKVNTGKLILNNGGVISLTSSQTDPGAGAGGTLQINANNIFLDQISKLETNTAFSTGGDIFINNNGLLLLRHNSEIITSAGGGNGNGGNIFINTPFLVAIASENSNIVANALKGQGGNIAITSVGIYGIAPSPKLTDKSDITASSEFGLNGTIAISTPGIDPGKGLSQLPSTPVDLSGLVSSGCSRTTQAKNNSFIVTGRGGLPIDPFNVLDIENYQFDLGVTSPAIAKYRAPIAAKIIPNNNWPLLEAQGWATNPQGQITLTSYNPHAQYVPIPVISCEQN
jgi:filamentous hemagglutinin family protein